MKQERQQLVLLIKSSVEPSKTSKANKDDSHHKHQRQNDLEETHSLW